jgi:hypothetical protein
MRPPPLVWRRYVVTFPASSSTDSIELRIPFLFLGLPALPERAGTEITSKELTFP